MLQLFACPLNLILVSKFFAPQVTAEIFPALLYRMNVCNLEVKFLIVTGGSGTRTEDLSLSSYLLQDICYHRHRHDNNLLYGATQPVLSSALQYSTVQTSAENISVRTRLAVSLL